MMRILAALRAALFAVAAGLIGFAASTAEPDPAVAEPLGCPRPVDPTR